MKKINLIDVKRIYLAPRIERIELDNEISLILQSDVNPNGEPIFSQLSEHFLNDPFKTNNV